jgi:hypothetical protein
MEMKKFINVPALFALALLSVSVSAQTPDAVFASFHQSLAKLRPKLTARDRQTLTQIDQDILFLKEKIDSGDLTPLPEKYLESLELNASLLREFAAKPKPRSEDERRLVRDGLEVVASDLAIKVSHLRSPKKGPTLVEVTVRAKANGQDANDYEVWYVPKGWANKDAVFKRFDKLTNQDRPPRMFLPPGNYFVWLKKEPSKTPRQPLTVGGDGYAKREVELLIP